MTGWKRPSLDTKFHIDYDWWESSGKDLRAWLYGVMPGLSSAFPDHGIWSQSIGWIQRLQKLWADALLQTIRSHCSKQVDFVSMVALVANIFAFSC
jgi:hypothetical protein